MSGEDQKVSEFQQTILSFYAVHGRELPWRETTEVYPILVSELMLQQTQVSRVVEKYTAFLEAFPTPKALLDASFTDVLGLWQGLGYNRRAQYVQNAAQLLVDTPAPGYEELLAVTGVGPYTAAAVCVFAYNEDRSAVDVNVRRVHKRFFGREVDDSFIARCVPTGRSREWHNALMDFGSLVCTKKAPGCSECLLAGSCEAYATGSFVDEPTSSQPRFVGSVRWHRGRVLAYALKQPVSEEELWGLLDERYRDKKKFLEALKQLRKEGFIQAGALVRVSQ